VPLLECLLVLCSRNGTGFRLLMPNPTCLGRFNPDDQGRGDGPKASTS